MASAPASTDPYGSFDVIEVSAAAHKPIDKQLETLLRWLSVEAGLEFEMFACDFLDEDPDGPACTSRMASSRIAARSLGGGADDSGLLEDDGFELSDDAWSARGGNGTTILVFVIVGVCDRGGVGGLFVSVGGLRHEFVY